MGDDKIVQSTRYTVRSEGTTTELVLRRLPSDVVNVYIHDTTDPKREAETLVVRLDAVSLRSLGHLCIAWAEKLRATADDDQQAET